MEWDDAIGLFVPMPILVDVLAMVVEAAEYDNLKAIFACHQQQVSAA